MKNIMKYLMTMTAAAIAVVACNVEEENFVPSDANALHITVIASPDEIQGDNDSKTYIDNKTIKWGTGEYMRIGVFDGTATTFGNSTDESADIWSGDTEALFNFSITPANSAAEYTYYGIYPASAAVASSNTNPASYKVNLPATQNATASSYDPKAYILVARPESGKTEANADWEASFRRATALNHLTLKNLSEDIKRVTITAPDGTYLAGARHFDLTASTMEAQNGDIYSGGGRTETIDVRFATKLTGGANMDVWFTSWEAEIPVDGKLTIVAYSDAHVFTREITVVNKPISFKEGYLNTLSVNMSSAVQTDNTELVEGNYVVLAKDGDNYYALKAEKESGKERLLSVAYDGDLDSYLGDADIIWSLTKSGDSFIFENDSRYLGYKGSNNESYWLAADENWTETNYLLDVTAQETAGLYHVTVHSNASRYLSKNSSNAFFAFYGNTGQKADIVFVPATVDNRTAVTLEFEAATAEFTNQAGSYDQFLGYSVTATAGEDDITDSIESALVWSIEDDDNVIDEWDNGALTLTGNTGTATVKVSFPGDGTYLPANEVSYTITVTDGSTPPTPTTGWFETALADLTSSDVFVIVGNDTYTISNAQSTSSAPSAATLASASLSLTGTAPNRSMSGTIPDGVKWTLTGNGTDGYTFYSNANSSYHLYNSTTASSKSNDAMRVGNPSSGTDRKLFVLDSGNHLVTNDTYTARYLACYNASDWRGYVSSGTSETTITFYKYVAAPDNREEAGMSWSAESATATYTTVNNASSLAFTAPTLTVGNATGITYESTDETIATISSTGVVSVNLTDNSVKEGSTTIKAVFEGDEDYKPQTVSYTLNVVDNRTAATTPTFDPAAGEVTANQVVTFNPTNQGLTFHYTVDGTEPTVSSPTAASVTIDAAKTVKVLATKTGYKPSAVASAAYTIAGAQANDGSLEHPYTASEARTLALGGDTGSYYITGIVTKVQNQYSASFGTANFWIDENGTSDSVFEGYKIKYFGNQSWVTGNAELALNDEVIIYGTLTLYNSTTPETSSGYLVSLNGTTKGLTLAAPTVTTNTANSAKEITVAWTAATGTESAVSYVITCGTQNYNATAAGSHTFTMSDYGTYSVSVAASASDAISATVTTSATLVDPSAGTPTVYEIQWGSAYNGSSVSSYTASWNATKDGFTVNMANWNNYNNGWDYVKCGRKNNASVATIITDSAISEAIRTVTITIDALTAAKINSITLYVSDSKTSGWASAGTFTKATGDQSVTIASPAANKYYKLEFDCASGTSNGLLTLSKAQFSTN